MALTGLHTNWLTGSYAGDREYILRAEENTDLFNNQNVAANLKAHFDRNNSLAIGYGLDLLVNSDATINSYLTAAGFPTLTSQDASILDQARAYRSSRLASGLPVDPQQMTTYVNQLSLNLLTDTNARGLLNVVANDHESKLIQDLTVGGMNASDLATFSGTREFAALVSLKFNGISPVVRDQNGAYVRNTKMLNAILSNERADAWFEIRYNSNGNDLAGLAKRRFFEADTFGLYRAGVTATTISDEEAKDVFRMYTQHRERILAYETKYAAQIAKANLDYQLVTDQVQTWTQDSQIARQYVLTTYAQFAGAPAITGEVLIGSNLGNHQENFVGSDLIFGDSMSYNNLHGQGGNDILYGNIGNDDLYGDAGDDVLFGESGNDGLNGGLDDDRLEGGAGNDQLNGGAGQDTLRGGTGDDHLYGGAGDDILEGGEGLDTYYYNSLTDGSDTIEDSDAKGIIKVDGRVLTGGIQKKNETTWKSPDGQFEYRLEGGHLKLTINGSTLTINENFQSGQFGIRLIDASTLPDGTPPTIEYNNSFPEDPLNPWMLDDADNSVGPLGGAGASSKNVTVFANGGNDWVFLHSGNLGNAQLFGGTGHDLLEAAQGHDRLYGEDGRDILLGGSAGDDVLEGGAGEDLLKGGPGQDVLRGGTENDAVQGDSGNDIVLGEGGDDVVGGDAAGTPTNLMGHDYVDGGDGADWVFGMLGNDNLLGGVGDDRLYGDQVTEAYPSFFYEWPGIITPSAPIFFFDVTGGSDFLDGGDGNDYLQGDAGDDVLLGGADNDHLWGDDQQVAVVQEGADWLEGGAGIDQLVGGGGADTLDGGDQNDTLYGDYLGNVTLGANDILDGGAGIDTLYGGGGQDLLDGGADGDVLYGDDGDDDLYGGAGADTLQGGEGHDTLVGEGEADVLFGNAGDDVLFGDDGIDQLSGGTGVDMLVGGTGNDMLFGDGDNDTLFGEEDNDQLQGGDGHDSLIGDAGNDVLFGEVGDDTLWGDEGADQLIGGTGNDIHDGGIGSDIYAFNLGDGHDHIFETDFFGDVNTISFGAGITSGMLTYTHDAAQETLLIQVGGGADSILIHGFTNTGVNGTGGMQNIAVGGFLYSLTNILGLPSGEIVGTFGNDLIATGSGADMIYAGDGHDTITANGGNDLLLGGTGHDTYVFNFGDGLDTIQDTATAGEGNRIVFGSGVTAANLTYTQSADALTIAYNGTADAIQLAGFNQNTVLGSLVVSTLEFADNSVVNLADLYPTFTNHTPTVATPIADQTAPEDVPWTFVVPANTFADQDVSDVLTYSASLADGSGLPSWLSFDPVTRTFTGTPDDAQVGTIGVRVTATDPRNANVSDTFNLMITNMNEAPTVANPLADQAARETEAFSFIVPSSAFVDPDVGDVLTYSATLDSGAPLPTWLTFNSATRSFSGTPQNADVGSFNVRVTATDSGNLTASDIFAVTVDLNHTFTGTPGNDTLVGTSGDDVLNGLGGNDVLSGLAGNDVLDGGTGADQLSGGDGDDILYIDSADYSIAGGAGYDTVYATGSSGVSLNVGTAGIEAAYGGAGNDTFSAFILTGSSIGVTIDAGGGNDWLIGGGGADLLIGGTGDDRYEGVSIFDAIIEQPNGGIDMVYGGLPGPLPSNVENWEGSDSNGETIGNELDNILTGASGRNVMRGLAGNDQLYGLGGADQLYGGEGDDLLVAGIGNPFASSTESLLGEDGNDTLVGSNSPTHTNLFGGFGDDTYVLGLDMGGTVIESMNEGTDTIQIENTMTYTLTANVENLMVTGSEAVNGTGNELANTMTGNIGNDVLSGGAGNDTLFGGEGNDTLTGGVGDDVLDSGSGIDNMTGGDGNDTFYLDTSDTISESSTGGIDTAITSQTYTLVTNLENLILTGTANINGIGNSADNVLTGNSGANVLTGGSGNDTYVIDSLDSIVEASNGGTDTVKTAHTYTLSTTLENLTLLGVAAINGTGNQLNNILDGSQNSAANVLTGGAGNDTYVLGIGDSVVENANEGTDTVQSSVTYTLGTNLENLTLAGTAAVNGTGNALNNTINGNSGANVLDGGAGADAMSGGAGDDTYLVDSTADTVTEATGAGMDTVRSTVTYTIAANVENLVLTGTAAINGTGNGSANVLDGSQNSAANVLSGGTGNDTYILGTGDTISEASNGGTDTVQSAVTYTLGTTLENLILTGTAAINGTGNTTNNVLDGSQNSAVNVLTGGTGNDTYIVGSGDTVTEAANAGMDTVQSAVTWILGANLENLTMTGTAASNGTGNTLNNILDGSQNSAANMLTGGAGNDTYVVSTGDSVVENANEGTDIIQSSVTWTLETNVENLTLTGTAAIDGTGNTLANSLTGNSAANTLDGGTGADAMSGETGDDTYVVDSTSDTTTEASGAGIDTVRSSVTLTLAANVENLVLTGAAAINGTGNTLNNVLDGSQNSQANVLTGGTGNDTYILGAGDTITEASNGGTDTVQSVVTYTLGVNIENLTLTGTTAINGTGNTGTNALTGNAAANVLDGGAGADTMSGGAGNDTYIVDNAGDTVSGEWAFADIDGVQSSVTFSLVDDSGLENLTLVGTTAINGTGNTLNNVLSGNSANNVLTGLGGNDTYQYTRGGGQDMVVDSSGTTDKMQFGATINPLDLIISRQVNDLRLSILGSSDRVTIQNWYGGATNQTETIQAGNGQALLNTHVDQLIQAMAQFTTDTGLSWDAAAGGAGTVAQQAQFQGILAANWQ